MSVLPFTRPLARVLATALWLSLGAGCASAPLNDDEGSTVTQLPKPTTGAYVSVAVDNHFHDIHPGDDIEIAAERPFVVRNEGRNLHNVTIAGTDVSRDLRPGKELRLPSVGEWLQVGKTYSVVCKYHAELGMTGEFTVSE